MAQPCPMWVYSNRQGRPLPRGAPFGRRAGSRRGQTVPMSDPDIERDDGATRRRLRRQAASITVAVAPFGIVFGASAATAGLRLYEALGYSVATMPDHFTEQFAPMPALQAILDATASGAMVGVVGGTGMVVGVVVTTGGIVTVGPALPDFGSVAGLGAGIVPTEPNSRKYSRAVCGALARS